MYLVRKVRIVAIVGTLVAVGLVWSLYNAAARRRSVDSSSSPGDDLKRSELTSKLATEISRIVTVSNVAVGVVDGSRPLLVSLAAPQKPGTVNITRVLENQALRQRRLAEVCARLGLGQEVPNFKTLDMYINDTLKYLYCVVNKVACTTWKRTLLMASGQMKVEKGEQLSMTFVHNFRNSDKYFPRIRTFTLEQVLERLKTHFKFMFVRHPLERLVSTYRDKFTKPAYYYKRRFGTKIIRATRPNATKDAMNRGNDVTFPEMVSYLLDPPPRKRHDDLLLSDNHWRREYDLCHPCFVKYDFIGHYETLYEDAQYVLQKLGVDDRVQFPNVDPDNKWKKKTAEVADKILGQISPQQLERVKTLYAVDFELFGYV